MKKSMLVLAALLAVAFAGCKDNEGGIKYGITLTNDGNGGARATIDGKMVTKAEEGEWVTLTAVANIGYEFDKWTVIKGDVQIRDVNAVQTTFDMPGEHVEIKVEFKESSMLNGNYKGTLTVSGEPGYSEDEVNITFTMTDDNTARIDLYQVKFDTHMPTRINMTMPNILATGNEYNSNIALGHKKDAQNNPIPIVPLHGGGEYPTYTITELSGTVTTTGISFTMMCGSYPVSFTGTRVQAE